MARWSLVIVIMLLSGSCRCDAPKGTAVDAEKTPPVEKSTKAPKRTLISPKLQDFFAQFENLLEKQDKVIEEDEEEKIAEQQGRMVQRAINQTLDELFSLDAAEQADRVGQLIKDLAGMGEPARDALIDLLGANLPRKHRVLVLKALGAFSDEKSGAVLYEEALRSADARSRQAALTALRGTKAKDALIEQSLAGIAAAPTEGEEREKTREETMGHIAVLGMIGGDAVVDELYEVVRTSDDEQARRAAVRAIGDIGGDAAKTALDDIMKSDPQLSEAAAAALGAMKQEEIVLGFGEILMNGASPVELRKSAIKGLGEDNSQIARRVLLNVLKDTRQPRDVHQAAVGVLIAGFGENAKAETINVIALFERTPVEYLPQMLQQLIAQSGDYGAAFLDRRYDRLKGDKKVHALRTLGKVNTPRSFALLAKHLEKEKDTRLRQEVLSAMSKHDAKIVDDKLLDALEGIAQQAKAPSERVEALKYVAKVSPEDAVEIAQKNVEGISEGSVVVASIDVLRAHGDWRSAVSLKSLKVNDKDGRYTKQIDAALKAIEARNK